MLNRIVQSHERRHHFAVRKSYQGGAARRRRRGRLCLWLMAVSGLLALLPDAARVQSTGNVFDLGANGVVNAIVVQPDGKIVVGGYFNQLGGVQRLGIGRINPNGTLDADFNPGAGGLFLNVHALALQADGKIVVGSANGVGPQARNNLIRLNPDGTRDGTFVQEVNPSGPAVADSAVYAIAVQPDGKIVVGGEFNRLNGYTREFIGRLHSDGTVDNTFNPFAGANSGVYALALQSDGKILVGGQFTRLAGQPLRGIGRLNADGTIDTTFTPGAGTGPLLFVFDIAVQSDGKIVVVGQFIELGGETRENIARLNANGTVDISFNPSVGPCCGHIRALAVQADGKIVVGGYFTQLGGQPRDDIGRYNANGTVDATFNPGAGDGVNTLALQSDGKILVGGEFTQLGGQPRSRVGRLNPNGTLDATCPTITVNPPALPNGAPGTPYSQTVTASGGSAPYSFARTAGTLPPGLSLAPNGVLSGTPTAAGNFTFTVAARDANNCEGSRQYTVTITNCATITLSPATLPGGTISIAYNQTITAGGGVAPYTFTVTAGTLPPGLWLNPDGTLYSTPTHPGTFNFTITARGANNCTGSRDYSITVAPSAAVDGFDPGADGSVYVLAVQADGKIIVGGLFGQLGGQPRNYISRLNPDGSLDAAFNPGVSSDGFTFVGALAVQADGKILVGGSFTQLGGQPRSNIGRLNPDGTLDTSFNPGASVSGVSALALQADGKIVVGGGFTQLGGQPRSRIGRLNPDGTLDTSFNPGVSNGTYDSVHTLAVQADGKIIIGGLFTQLGGQPRSNVGRLNPNGSLDAAFNPGANGSVGDLALQSDGKIVVSGDFTMLGGQQRDHIGRLNPNGSPDTSFNPGVSMGQGLPTSVSALTLQSDGKILVGGAFTQLGGQPRNSIGRLNADGTLDASFNPGAGGYVYALAVQSDGKIVVGGYFTHLGGQPRNNIGRLNPDGSLDATLNPGANASVSAIAMQADGKIIVGGDFTQLAGQPRGRIGRLNADGTLETSFNPGANGLVSAIAVQADGKIIVGGNFTQLGGQPRTGIGRLNANGALDASFNPQVSGSVYTFALQSDGKIVVGGQFTQLGGQARGNIGRLNADGSPDASFNPGANGSVSVVAVQSDGKSVVGGTFTQLGGQPRTRIGRVNPDGTLDATFNPGANDGVFALVVQSDGKIVGDFNFIIRRLNPDGTLDTSFNSGTNGIVRTFALQADGKILVGGTFSALGGSSRLNVGRLNPNGTIDASFNPGANNQISALAVQSDGKILAGGLFTQLGGQPRNYVGRLANTGAALQNLSVYFAGSASGIAWSRGGTSPEVDRVTFERSTDGLAYTFLGNGTRVAGAWQLTGVVPPQNQNIFVRARGFYGTDGAGSVVESVRNAFGSATCPTITVNPPTLPAGIAYSPYSQTLTAGGAGGPFNFAVTGGALPPGLTLNPTTGALSGEPTQPGAFSFTVTATDTTSGCAGSRSYSIDIGCPLIVVNPLAQPGGTVGTYYNKTITANGGDAPYNFAVMDGALPPGLTMSSAGVISGTPTATGSFNFYVTARDANNCTGSRSFTINITDGSGPTGLQYYALPAPVRLLDTRPGQTACDTPGAPLAAGGVRTQAARTRCAGVPSSALAVVGNATVVNNETDAGSGFITLYPSGAPLPTASNLNYVAGQIVANSFTTKLGGDGAINIYASSSTHFIVDVTGYYAPPNTGGLYYHPLPRPVRLLDTRSGQSACDTPGAPLSGGASRTQLARTTCDGVVIPQAARAVVGNATVVNTTPAAASGFITLYPSGATRPNASNLNYVAGQIVPNSFTVGLGADGAFAVYASSETHFIVDIAGYYSTQPADINGTGLLYYPLDSPARLLDTRAGQTACDAPGAPLVGGFSHPQVARTTCAGQTVPAGARAVVGNATVVNNVSGHDTEGGFVTLYPSGATPPTVSNLNYAAGQIVPNSFVVGLNSADGAFGIYPVTTINFIVDLTGYFAP